MLSFAGILTFLVAVTIFSFLMGADLVVNAVIVFVATILAAVLMNLLPRWIWGYLLKLREAHGARVSAAFGASASAI